MNVPRVDELPELCTIGETRKVLRVGKTKVYELVRSGVLRKVEGLGGAIRIPRSELERLVNGEAESDVQLRRVK